MTGPLRHAVVIGTIREGRFADKPANCLMQVAADRNGASYDLIDLRDHPLPLFADAHLPSQGSGDTDAGEKWRHLLGGYDGFVFITAEGAVSLMRTRLHTMQLAL